MSTAKPKKTSTGGASGKTRRRLIEAARAEFSTKGIECATTRGIADRADCNEVTLFRNFESKEKLLAAVVQETSDEFRLLCNCPKTMCGDLRTDLTRFAVAYNESLERCEGMTRVLIGEGRRRPTLVKELIGDVMEPFHHSLSSYFESQINVGRIRGDVRPIAIAELLTATLMAGLLRRTSELSELTREEWISETIDLTVRAIEARPTA
jgi:AcrR family transcriptional regulator